ncbi:MAG: Gx transporter family protein [Clostridia bacterium]|nr:Gx transporter family protein [Clostridia bacterium]
MSVRRLTRGALLTTIALTIFMLEAQIPAPVPIPGIKLGLANIVTLWALFSLGPWDALGILLARTFLGSLFSGQMMTLLYSLAGGLLCWAVGCGLRRLLTLRQMWLCGILGAMAHNIGQMAVAVALTGTWGLLAYLPVLMVTGAAAGAFTGLAARFLAERLDGSGGGKVH